MFVVKRSGEREPVQLDKITARISNLCRLPDIQDLTHVDPVLVATKVVAGLFSGVTTRALDALAVETASALTVTHYHYADLASRIAVSNLHKSTPSTFSEAIRRLAEYEHPITGAKGVISDELVATVAANAQVLDAAIVPERDYDFTIFGFKTLERAYLLKCGDEIVERPSYMLMRVALGIHGDDIDAALKMYDSTSRHLYTSATPTLFNSGSKRPQLASCFLLDMRDDIDSIFKTISDTAKISKFAGGIGVAAHDVRAKGSYIAGTGGVSNGIIPMLRVFNNVSRYIDQGGGKRPGSIAVYLEPHHPDIFEFLQIRKNHGNESERARDLFTAMWISDLFMQRVSDDGNWSLFCPHECPGLSHVYGEAFNHMYEAYEQRGMAKKTVKAQSVWKAIVESQIETGTPYILFKDSINCKSNQKNVGVIQSSNLCSEILEFTSEEETAVCNLASLNVSAFVRGEEYDFDGLVRAAEEVAFNLNRVIDRTYYPIPETQRSNSRHRPIGVGQQGLHDAFMLMRMPFDSPEAAQLSRDIAEAIYFGCVSESCRLAEVDGPYDTFEGSPASEGKLQFDLWNDRPSHTRFDWDDLADRVKWHGLRNSLLTAQMPTASTSSILGRIESVEALTSNVYVRRTNAGDYIIINRYLVDDLQKLGKWGPEMVNQLIADDGSVQRLDIPAELKHLYKTTWEISQKTTIEQAAARGAFIDQSQSMNLFLESPTFAKVTSMLFYGWKQGLKTGMYYLRSRPKASPIQFTVDKSAADASRAMACRRDNPNCEACSA